jgi:hypothetical protein
MMEGSLCISHISTQHRFPRSYEIIVPLNFSCGCSPCLSGIT